jgi:hypothetical protein
MISKFWNFLKEVGQVIGKFLKYVYAPYMVMSLMCVLLYALVAKILGVVFFVITILLSINEIKQNNNIKIGG